MIYWGRILRNVFSNWAGYVLSSLIGFLLAPFLVHALGKSGYGVWTLVISFTGYFGLLDLGIRSSVGRFVARYRALDDDHSANQVVSTAFLILSAGGLLAILTTLIAVRFFFARFQIGPELEVSGKAALLIVGLNISFILPMGIFSSVLIAIERYDVLNTITVIGELMRCGLVVAVIKMGYGLAAISGVMLLTSAAQYTAVALVAKSLYPALKVALNLVNWATFRDLGGFGVFRFVVIVANQLIFYSDSLVIGFFLGAGAITSYAIAGSLINMGRNFVLLVTDTFVPAAARMDAGRDMAGLRRLLTFGTRMALLIALPLCLGFLFLGKQFLILWMGKEFASSAVILSVLTIPQFSSMSQYVSISVLSAMAKHRLLAYLAMAEGIVNLSLSIILVRRIGVIGVAWGTVIPHLITTAVIMPCYTLRVLRMPLRDYFMDGYVRPVLCAVPIVGICYGLSTVGQTPRWLLFCAEVIIVCGVYGILSYFFCFESEHRAALVCKLRKAVNREPVAHEA